MSRLDENMWKTICDRTLYEAMKTLIEGTEEMADDPLVKLKQQEIDLRAMETMLKTKEEKARLEKDWTIDSERIDLDRDKLESQVGIDLLKTKTAEADLKSKEKLAALKENMAVVREEMKGRSNGKGSKKN